MVWKELEKNFEKSQAGERDFISQITIMLVVLRIYSWDFDQKIW